jgi:hypothetical protein
MSPRFVAAILLFALPALAHAGVSIVHVWPSQRTADSFRRISEYMSGSESSGRDTLLRTKPDSHVGCYFLTRLKADAPQPAATLVLEVVIPGSPAVRTFSFPVDIPSGGKVFHIGVTGADWPSVQTRPSAWRVSVRTADGTVLADSPSFLWRVPASK